MSKEERSDYELKRRCEWWLDLSKLALGSIAVPIFLAEMTGGSKVVFGVGSLTAFTVCAIIGFRFAGLVKE